MSRRLSESRALVAQPQHEPAVMFHDDGLHHSRMDPREIIRILRRHLRILVATTLILLAAAILFVTTVTPLYTATSSVLIDPRRASLADPTGQPVLTNFGTDDASIESQVLLIQSIAVLQRAVERLKLTEDPEFMAGSSILDPIKRLLSTGSLPAGMSADAIAKANAVETLQRRLKVIRQRGTFMVDISASSVDSEKAAVIANAIAESYLLEQVRSKYDATKIAAGWLDRQLADLKARVITSDRAVADFRAANNLMVAQGVTVNDQQISDLNNKLVEARAEAAEARARFDQVQQMAKTGADPGALAEALSSNTIAQLRTQHADLAKNAADLSSRYGQRHPLVAAAHAQVRDTQRLVNDEVQRTLLSRRHSYEVAAAREKSLEQSLDQLQGVSTVSGQAQVRLRELQREADANRTLYESFLSRYKEASAQESLELPESRVVTSAQAPIRPSFPKVWLVVGLAGVLGVGLGSVLALLSDYLDPRVKTLEQAEATSGVPGVAAVPLVGLRELARMAKRGRRELQRYDPRVARLLPAPLQPPLMRYVVERPTSMFAEAIRTVRLAVQQAGGANSNRIVLVTSAIDGEGKTTLAANLALSFATIGIKTILVEGDLRNPEMTRSLCPRVTSGLLEVAIGDVPLHQAVLIDSSTGLSILPAPSAEGNAMLADLMFSARMGSVFEELRLHYDVIVVDAPPVIPLVDGRALAEVADHVVLAMQWDHTPLDLLARTVDLLDHVHDRVVGTVLTQVDLRRVRLYERYPQSKYLAPYDGALRPSTEAAE
jgi:polysaccharide biosynthesis transport protein